MEYPTGILEDVLIKAIDLYVLVDFVILETEDDMRTPSFLRGLSWPPPGAILMSKIVSCLLIWEMIIWSSTYLRLLNFLPFLMNVI